VGLRALCASVFLQSLTYGEVIQLRHEASRCFLHVCDRILSDTERNASVLRLFPEEQYVAAQTGTGPHIHPHPQWTHTHTHRLRYAPYTVTHTGSHPNHVPFKMEWRECTASLLRPLRKPYCSLSPCHARIHAPQAPTASHTSVQKEANDHTFLFPLSRVWAARPPGCRGGESAYFKIMPRFKIHSEGDCVSADDKVVLMSVKGSRRVHLSSSHMPTTLAATGAGGAGAGASVPPMIGASAARRLEVTASHVRG
jgi:hypothetical protein